MFTDKIFARYALTSSIFIAGSMLAGCGMGSLQTSSATATSGEIGLGGAVHGGQQGVSGSVVQLYLVGTGGYGASATPLGTAATTDQFGSFTLTGNYTCPAGNPLVYVTATGGNPGLAAGSTNPNLKLMAALGQCNTTNLNPGTQIAINEVSTVAAAYALGQFFTTTYGATSTDSFGGPNTTQGLIGISNAFNLVPNLVGLGTGNAVATATIPGTAGSVTIVPDSLKLNTIANIIAACVNSAGGTSGDGSNCGVLFGDTYPTGGTPATDTLQAAVYLSLNPTSTNANGSSANITALYGLIAASSAPFSAQTSAPTDWTLGINYVSSAAFLFPQNIAADGSGNIWVLSNNGGASGNLAEITNAGSLLVTSPLTTTVGTASASLTATNPRNLAIDTNGNVFVTASSSSGFLFEYSTAGAASAIAIGRTPYGLAIDGSNNVFVAQQSSTSPFGLTEYLGGILATTSQVEYPQYGAATVAAAATTNPIGGEYAAFDFSGNLWFDAGVTTNNNAYQLTNISTASCTAFPCQVAASTAAGGTNYQALYSGNSLSTPYGLAAGTNPAAATNDMWIVDNGGANGTTKTPNVSEFTNAGAAVGAYGPTDTAQATPAARFIASDGSGNMWVSIRGSQTLVEFSATGTVLSPNTNGFAHSTNTSGTAAGIAAGNGVTIDPSGNVWIANNATSNPNSVFELIGAAAPTVTPLATQISNGKVSKP